MNSRIHSVESARALDKAHPVAPIIDVAQDGTGSVIAASHFYAWKNCTYRLFFISASTTRGQGEAESVSNLKVSEPDTVRIF